MTPWLCNARNNPQTFLTQETFSDGFGAALLGELVMRVSIPRPRSRTFLCLLTSFGLPWNKKHWMIWSHADVSMPVMSAFITTLLEQMDPIRLQKRSTFGFNCCLCAHLSSELWRSSRMCFCSPLPSVHLVLITFCKDTLNLILRAMRGRSSTSNVFWSFFRDCVGSPRAAVCPDDANLWVNNNCDHF